MGRQGRGATSAKWAAALVVTAAILMAAPAAASAAGWGSEFSVSGTTHEGTSARRPVTAIDPAGNVYYAWEQELPSGGGSRSIVETRVAHADGTVGPIEEVTGLGDPGESLEPHLGVDAAGHARIAWLQEQESCTPVCSYAYQLDTVALDSSGAPAGGRVELASYPLGAALVSELHLAVGADGTAAVAVEAYSYSEEFSSLRVLELAPGGTTAQDISPAAEPVATEGLALSVAPSDQVFAAWLRYESATNERWVEGAMLSPTTTPSPQPLSAHWRYISGLAGAVDVAGGATVTYTGDDLSFEPLPVFAARMSSTGVASSPLELTSGSEPALLGHRPLAVTADGTALVVWSEANAVFGRSVSPAGIAGPTHQITEAGEPGSEAVIAAWPSEAVVVFHSAVEEGEEFQLVRQRPLDLGAAPLAPATTLGRASSSARQVGIEALAAAASGDAGVAWIDSDFSIWEVRGAIRDATPPALTLWAPAKAVAGAPVVVAAGATDRSPVSFAWDFGDGTGAGGSPVEHAFAAPGAYTVTVRATDAAGNAATGQARIEVVPTSAAAAVPVRPAVELIKGPPKKSRSRTASLSFTSSAPGSSYECALDGAGWKSCRSPLKLKHLSVGSHAVEVRAVDPAGVQSQEPLTVRFRVLKSKPKH